MSTKESLETRIAKLAAEGLGRPTIIQEIPEATEWQVRKVIKKLKSGEMDVSDELQTKADRNVRRTALEIVSDLRPLEVKVPKVNKPKAKKHDMFTVAVVGDTHGECVDERAFDVACQVIQDLSPDMLVHVGDLGDFYSVSRFDKNPNRKLTLQEDLLHASKLLGMLDQTVSDSTEKILVEGNHETRLSRYISHNAPALADMPELQMERLLGTESLGWEYVTQDKQIARDFIIKHGNIVRGKGGYTARAEMEKAWLSGISGHTHRLSMVQYTTRRHSLNRTRPAVWIENGCLCQMEAEYLNGTADWQHGFTILRFDEYGPIPELIQIVDGQAYFNGKIYRS